MALARIIRASLQCLMIEHTFLILLLPLLVALFYYSTPHTRSQPIFILNAISLILALIVGVISDALNVHYILSPQYGWSERFQMTIGFMGNFQMMLVDTILLLRLITVYPLSRVGFPRFVLLTFLPITLKAARLINTSIFIYQSERIASRLEDSRTAEAEMLALPYEKIEWIAQVVDNSYASIAFLWTIWWSRYDTKSAGLIDIKASHPHQSFMAKRIQILFKLALSNFIIPTIISIVQLVMLFHNGNSNIHDLNSIAYANTNASIIGVVFATVWAGKEHRREIKAVLDLPPVECEQRHMPENLAMGESYQGDQLSSTFDEDITVVDSQDFMRVAVPLPRFVNK